MSLHGYFLEIHSAIYCSERRKSRHYWAVCSIRRDRDNLKADGDRNEMQAHICQPVVFICSEKPVAVRALPSPAEHLTVPAKLSNGHMKMRGSLA